MTWTSAEDGILIAAHAEGRTDAEISALLRDRTPQAVKRAWPEDPDGWLVHVERTTARHAGAPKRRAWNDQTSGAWERAGVRREVWDTQPTADGSRRNGHPLHAFRRGVITGLLALGADLPDVQYLVGHQLAGGVTTDRYTDPTIARKLRATVDLIPPIRDVETRAIQGGVVVWLDAVTEGRWRSTR